MTIQELQESGYFKSTPQTACNTYILQVVYFNQDNYLFLKDILIFQAGSLQ